ncbi:MAG: hypothetical protein INR71_10385 [Terriglobus roseus]|nr:hypothetical protein [Terriglobus roseus]
MISLEGNLVLFQELRHSMARISSALKSTIALDADFEEKMPTGERPEHCAVSLVKCRQPLKEGLREVEEARLTFL